MSTHDANEVERLVSDYLGRRIGRRRFFQRAVAIGLSSSAAASLLAACGSGDDAGGSGGTTAAGADDGGAPVAGGILREGYDRDVSRLDPVSTTWWDASLFPATHETLLTADADGTFIPLLAESWTTSDDSLTWTFKLRPDLRFQSGAACDARAVVAALDVIRKNGVNAGFWTPVTKVRAADATTVEIKLKTPFADLPFVLNSGYSAIFNKSRRDQLGNGYGVKGVDGTGPFTLSEYVAGSHATLARWDDYPGPGDADFFENKGTAHLEGLRFEVLLEPTTRAQELEAGNLDALHGPAPQDLDRLKQNNEVAVIEFQEWGMYQIGVNFKRTDLGFGDVRVRQALSHAIDRKTIAEKVFFGSAVPTYTLVPPAFPWYESDVAQAGSYDPEQAKSLLREAGFADGAISFKTIVEEEKVEQQVAQAVQAMFGEVGVKMQIEVLGAEYWERAAKGPDAFMLHNVWPYMFDASLLFSGSANLPPACCNYGYASISDLDKAFAAWQSAADDAALEAASRRAQTVFADTMPFIPIVTPLNLWAHRKNVHGWVPTQPNLYPFYQDVWLEQA